MTSINTINHIIDNLYASSKEIPEKQEILNQNNIKIIISLNGQTFYYPNITSYTFETEDNPDYDMRKHYDFIYNIIENNNNPEQNILVHCDAGVSRTGAIVIYYLIRKYNLSYNQAFEYATSKRPCISPNNGFELALRLLELKNQNQNPTKNHPGIHFLYYHQLVDFLNLNDVSYIIGIGNGMSYGNRYYKIDNIIDDLLENYKNIKEDIMNNNSSIIIYGTIYLIDMIKIIYYKKNDNNNLTNEEYDKINNKNLVTKFNIFDIDLSLLDKYKKSDLHQLLSRLDVYSCKDINERIYKKNIVKKIEGLI
jgi:protein-tyrosine phosphatase